MVQLIKSVKDKISFIQNSEGGIQQWHVSESTINTTMNNLNAQLQQIDQMLETLKQYQIQHKLAKQNENV